MSGMATPLKAHQWEGFAALGCVPLLLLAWLDLGRIFVWIVTILPFFFGLAFAISALRFGDASNRSCAILALILFAAFIVFIFLPASRAF